MKIKCGTKAVIAIIIMTIFDYIATIYGVLGGYASEANPLASLLFGWSFIGGLVIMGIISATGIAFLAKYINKSRWLFSASMFVVGLKTAITYFHLYWILSLLK